MNLLRKITIAFLVLSFIMCSPVCMALEIQEVGDSTPEVCSVNGTTDKYLLDAEGNQYGYTQWESFGAARRYYGVDRTYYACSRDFGGAHYNFCYLYADGLYMFFGVK